MDKIIVSEVAGKDAQKFYDTLCEVLANGKTIPRIPDDCRSRLVKTNHT